MTIKIYGDGGHSTVLRTLPLTRSLNRRICGFAFGYAQISQSETSHIPRTLYDIPPRSLEEFKSMYYIKEDNDERNRY